MKYQYQSLKRIAYIKSIILGFAVLFTIPALFFSLCAWCAEPANFSEESLDAFERFSEKYTVLLFLFPLITIVSLGLAQGCKKLKIQGLGNITIWLIQIILAVIVMVQGIYLFFF